MYDIRWQKVWLIVLTLIGLAAVPLIIYLSGHADEISFGGPCFLWKYFHLYCPTCGGTRSVQYFVSGRFVESMLANPAPMVMLVFYVRIWAALLYNCVAAGKNTAGEKKKMVRPLTDMEAWGILIAVVVYFVFRNLLMIFFKVDYLGDLVGYWQ